MGETIIEPYVGPRPFVREDASVFFGRDREAKELLSLIIAHPVVLLYSQSGAGKTSLLNARVIPLLEGRHTEVFGTARVFGELPQGVTAEQVVNIFVFNALMSFQKESSDPQGIARLSLSQFLSAHQPPARPQGISSYRVIIFDQFEELFTTFPERWNDRGGFFENVGQALEDDPRLRVVFSMREEYIASMDPFAGQLPERMRTRYRLERLREEAALLAVKKPLEGTGRRFGDGAAEKLVKNLLQVPIRSETGTIDVSGEFIEPVQLQVVCQNLWQSLPQPPAVPVIDDKYIEDYGDVDRALSTYYEECLKKVIEDQEIALIGLKEGRLRRWFEKTLITPEGTRGTVYRDKDTNTTGGLPNKAVDLLENLRLVRPELRGNAPWYELTHDRFIGPILKSNQEWYDKREKGKLVGQGLEERAKNWALNDKPDSDLLVGEELAEASQWLTSPDAEDVGVSDKLRVFVQTSHAEVERKRAESASRFAKRLKGQRAALILLAVVALLTAGYAVRASLRESRARKEAQVAQLKERGNIAQALSQQRGREFDALVLGLKAVDAPANEELPPEASEGLGAAVKAVGNSIWLRGSKIDFANFSLDGKRVMTVDKDEIRVWDAGTGDPLFHKARHPSSRVDFSSLSPDGKSLFFVSSPSKQKDGTSSDLGSTTSQQQDDSSKLHVWDVATDSTLPHFEEALKGSTHIQFSQDGRLIMTYTAGERVRLFDGNTAQLLQAFHEPREKMVLAGLSPGGTRVASITSDGVVHLWDTQTGQQLLADKKHKLILPRELTQTDSVNVHIEFSYDDSRFTVSGDPAENMQLWDGINGKWINDLKLDPPFDVERIAFSANSEKVAVFGTNFQAIPLSKRVETFNASTGQMFSVDDLPWLSRRNILFIKAQFFYIQANSDGSNQAPLSIYDAFSKEDRKLPIMIPTETRLVSVSGDLSHLITIDRDGIGQIWDLSSSPLNVADWTIPRLREQGCRQLQYQKEFNQDAQVKSLCEKALKISTQQAAR